ncbi:RNA polymerase sigma factor sigA [Elaeis guineensis]|uniref:RNA polymerase sigma factor sigA n=1 Tax=Elaeis guineensis var. tenera TaxID=51953 RepID=A0A6I9QJ11_ELAGV|nr:RNA polymerase sigma factor sigA [Elaeis guineensis]XP_010910228.1 RNA polymerase sigma factor sigA [Elaeis guineensis]XP_010910230.1 RNA polymerase sigma factor sigA [Elaeis guineensis]XP_010910231.1 RNA polymerase sigma factor sigA [Elaeis guineensis]XP_010910232.1 RNA polymerase sigma factor sigA [Elaeis guineensis]XP_010910235.1 RNA polymerase sigma factor sigA [Elaeis guineensis]XP_010910236.1 RNA polymerase sigma factor sigA [Elaeis guineensis]XP_019703121.1 RNA polymerase sigma fac
MAMAAVFGLSRGKRLLSTSFYPSDLAEKLFAVPDHASMQFSTASTKNTIAAKKSSNFSTNIRSNRHSQAIKALKEHVDTSALSTADTWFQRPDLLEDGESDLEYSLEVLLLLQKSMLEKQRKLPFEQIKTVDDPRESCKKTEVIRSGISARKRRTITRMTCFNQNAYMEPLNRVKEGKELRSTVSPELLQMHVRGYVRGTISQNLLSHAEVVHLSRKIRAGLSLEENRMKLKEKLGFEPSDKQLASFLGMSNAELHSKLTECSLAREKLAMSNVRLVMSIAQKYDNLGAEMADLIQGGLIGLLRGIEKFDSSKGCKISTYVYWWIRHGVSRALVENSRTLRLPAHLHERLSLIRNAKVRLEDKGIIPSIDNIAESLNMSQKKVRNATEAVSKVFSLDREAFPSLNGLPGETLHSYIADKNLGNNPWHGFENWSLKDEVDKLLRATLNKRERAIIRLYYGIGGECHTWEGISRQFGLSRERVRQVGLVALEKLKHAARRRRLEALLVKQ